MKQYIICALAAALLAQPVASALATESQQHRKTATTRKPAAQSNRAKAATKQKAAATKNTGKKAAKKGRTRKGAKPDYTTDELPDCSTPRYSVAL